MAYLGNVNITNGVLNVVDDKQFTKSFTPLSYNYTPENTNLAYWPLNDDSLDYSGNGNHLYASGTTTDNYPNFIQTTHFNGKMANYNGVLNTSSSYFTTAGNLLLPSDNWAWSCWIWLKSVSQGNFIVAGNLPSYAPYHTFFGVDNGALGGIVGGNEWYWSSGLNVSANAWHHVVVSRDTTNYHYYLDGVEGTPKEKTCPNDNFGFTIGMGSLDNGAGYRQTSGYMREVIIDNTYWDLAKVTTYYNANK